MCNLITQLKKMNSAQITLSPQHIISVLNKPQSIKLVWWYNIETGEFIADKKKKHLDLLFKEINSKPGWVHGLVGTVDTYTVLMVYENILPALQLIDILDKNRMEIGTIDLLVNKDGNDLSNLLEALQSGGY